MNCRAVEVVIHVRAGLLLLLVAVVSAALPSIVNGAEEQEVAALSRLEAARAAVADNHDFFGLAVYFNHVTPYLVTPDAIKKIEYPAEQRLDEGQYMVLAGRHTAMVISATQGSAPTPILKSDLALHAAELDQIRYARLIPGLGMIARLAEAALVWIQAHVVESWGLAIVVFGFLTRAMLVPVSLLTERLQRQVAEVEAVLEPQLKAIKAKFDGEEAHQRIMAAYKELGVSPFFSLKPMLGLVIQIPILIGIFNALGEMPQLAGQSFLWIGDLAYPDSLGSLGFTVPCFGDRISLLPVLMAAVTVAGAISHGSSVLPAAILVRQRKRLYWMALAFLILFYPFPAAIVLYWTISNATQWMQQGTLKLLRRVDQTSPQPN